MFNDVLWINPTHFINGANLLNTWVDPLMAGNMIGFGSYHYVYDSGHEGDAFLCGFAVRKQNITLYIMGGFHQFDDLMKKLGKHSTGKGCLYINKLADVDTQILKEIISKSVKAAGASKA